MIFNKLLKVFERLMPEMDTSKINMKSVLATDLGITSITALLFVIGIEDEFNFKFENVKQNTFITVEDVCKYIESRI